MTTHGAFLETATSTPETETLFAGEMRRNGYVMNYTKVWAHHPEFLDGMRKLFDATSSAAQLTVRQRGILITSLASTLGDSYCSLAWGKQLAAEADPELAAEVLRGDDGRLDASERALASWARKVAGDPNDTSAADIQALRDAGFDDAQVLAITVFVSLRLAFSTVNDALGAHPDAELMEQVPGPVRTAVSYGRSPDSA